MYNTIEFVTFAITGNAQDFGDLSKRARIVMVNMQTSCSIQQEVYSTWFAKDPFK